MNLQYFLGSIAGLHIHFYQRDIQLIQPVRARQLAINKSRIMLTIEHIRRKKKHLTSLIYFQEEQTTLYSAPDRTMNSNPPKQRPHHTSTAFKPKEESSYSEDIEGSPRHNTIDDCDTYVSKQKSKVPGSGLETKQKQNRFNDGLRGR